MKKKSLSLKIYDVAGYSKIITYSGCKSICGLKNNGILETL